MRPAPTKCPREVFDKTTSLCTCFLQVEHVGLSLHPRLVHKIGARVHTCPECWDRFQQSTFLLAGEHAILRLHVACNVRYARVVGHASHRFKYSHPGTLYSLCRDPALPSVALFFFKLRCFGADCDNGSVCIGPIKCCTLCIFKSVLAWCTCVNFRLPPLALGISGSVSFKVGTPKSVVSV